jgi:hypothetical protein
VDGLAAHLAALQEFERVQRAHTLATVRRLCMALMLCVARSKWMASSCLTRSSTRLCDSPLLLTRQAETVASRVSAAQQVCVFGVVIVWSRILSFLSHPTLSRFTRSRPARSRSCAQSIIDAQSHIAKLAAQVAASPASRLKDTGAAIAERATVVCLRTAPVYSCLKRESPGALSFPRVVSHLCQLPSLTTVCCRCSRA